MYIRGIPVVDLHRHLDGSVRLETMLDLARQHSLDMPAGDVQALRPHAQLQCLLKWIVLPLVLAHDVSTGVQDVVIPFEASHPSWRAGDNRRHTHTFWCSSGLNTQIPSRYDARRNLRARSRNARFGTTLIPFPCRLSEFWPVPGGFFNFGASHHRRLPWLADTRRLCS